MLNHHYQTCLIICLVLCTGHRLAAQRDTLFICDPGDPIQLSVGEGNFAYQWSPVGAYDNPFIANPTVRPLEPSIYTVRRIPSVTSNNLIVNPDFSQGNAGFSSDYDFVERINIQGVYGVDVSAANLNGIFFEDCPDHTSGDGPMMVVDGSPTRGEQVWCQTIEVNEGKDYAFSAWLTSVNPMNPAALQFSINGEPIGNIFRASNQVCQWRQFYEIWNAESAMEAEICIVNQNTNPAGNDFAMDDFAFFELEEVLYDTVVVLIEALTAAEDRRVYLPNAFSPNFDGRNDTFGPFVGKGVSAIELFQVYDRWGNLVFERKDCSPNETDCAWDGRFKGRSLPPDYYIYQAQVRYADEVLEVKKGSVLLMK
jgi:gliding motility-associated-like protein